MILDSPPKPCPACRQSCAVYEACCDDVHHGKEFESWMNTAFLMCFLLGLGWLKHPKKHEKTNKHHMESLVSCCLSLETTVGEQWGAIISESELLLDLPSSGGQFTSNSFQTPQLSIPQQLVTPEPTYRHPTHRPACKGDEDDANPTAHVLHQGVHQFTPEVILALLGAFRTFQKPRIIQTVPPIPKGPYLVKNL